MTTIAVLDYGAGNVRSAVRAAQAAGAEVTLTAETISRLFTRYRQLGLLECTGREVHLLDLDALHQQLQYRPRRLQNWPADSASLAS